MDVLVAKDEDGEICYFDPDYPPKYDDSDEMWGGAGHSSLQNTLDAICIEIELPEELQVRPGGKAGWPVRGRIAFVPDEDDTTKARTP